MELKVWHYRKSKKINLIFKKNLKKVVFRSLVEKNQTDICIKDIYWLLCEKIIAGRSTVGSRDSKHAIGSLPFLLPSLGLTLLCVGTIFGWACSQRATGSFRLITLTKKEKKKELIFPSSSSVSSRIESYCPFLNQSLWRGWDGMKYPHRPD